MHMEMDLRNNCFWPITLLKIAKKTKELNKGDSLEIITDNKNTIDYILNIFKFYNPLLTEENIEDNIVYYRIILRK